MDTVNFNGKTFSLFTNSEHGKVNSHTIFEYQQSDRLVTADYHGGAIVYGKIIALHQGDYLDMRYQCLTTTNALKIGKAIAKISELPNGKIKLSLNWKWIDSDNNSGTSEYIEN